MKNPPQWCNTRRAEAIMRLRKSSQFDYTSLGYNRRPMYRDRKSRPITLYRFAHLMENSQYRQLAFKRTRQHAISTIWLGLDHSFGFLGGPAELFETMVFCKHGAGCTADRHQEREITEKRARKMHNVIVNGIYKLEREGAQVERLG